MTNWLLKFGESKATQQFTKDLADIEGVVIYRALKATGTYMAHVQRVVVGDHLHAFHGSSHVPLGVYEVVDLRQHGHARLFGPIVTNTVLHEVVDSDLYARLLAAGYAGDVEGQALHGWPVRRTAEQQLPYDYQVLQGQVTLGHARPPKQ